MKEMNVFGKTELTYEMIKKTLKHKLELAMCEIFTKEYSEKFIAKLMRCSSDVNEVRKIFTEYTFTLDGKVASEQVILNDSILEKLAEIIYDSESKVHLITRPITHYELFKFYTSDTHKVIETNHNIKLLKEVLKTIDFIFEDVMFKLSEKVIASGDFTSCGIKQNRYVKNIKKIDFNIVDEKINSLTMEDIEKYRYDSDNIGNADLNRNLTTEQELEDVKRAYLALKPALQGGYCFYRWLTGSVAKDDLEVR